MGDVGPEKLAFPVLCLSHDTSIVVNRDADDLCRCNALAFWSNRYYRNLRVIDSSGTAYTVIDAEPARSYSPTARLVARLTNWKLTVRLRLRSDGAPSLATAKRLASEWLDKAPDFWEASADLTDWKGRVQVAATMGELIEVFE